MSIYEFDEEREMRLIREDERKIGREEGIEIGKASGIMIGRASGMAEGERRITVLYKCLLKDNRIEDWDKAIEDSIYCNKLYEEYSI